MEFFLIQTPQYPPGATYDDMVSAKHGFLVQLKEDEHLFLFSAGSLDRFLSSVGFHRIVREPAIFDHYDQFVVALKGPLERTSPRSPLSAARPEQRLVQALLDGRERVEQMRDHWQEAERDRAERLQVIERQGDELAVAESQRNDLKAQLTDMEEHFRGPPSGTARNG